LPIDPTLHRFPRSLQAGRAGRFAPIDFVEADDDDEIVAPPHAAAGASSAGRARIDVPSRVAGRAAERKRGRA
jgi:hypothetical protein